MAAAAATAGRGQVADYIPVLAGVDPHAFGMALVTLDGEIYGVGEVERPFSIQSVSKLFTLALLLPTSATGSGRASAGSRPATRSTPWSSWSPNAASRATPSSTRVPSWSPTGCSRHRRRRGSGARLPADRVRQPELDTDPAIARSEAEHGHRNAALAHFIASYGNLQNPVDPVLEHYYAHCAIEASCRDLARAGLFLAKHGMRADGRRLLGRSDAKRINAVMLTCGTYDAAGEFAYRVGLPAKSGVGGGVLAVIPGRHHLCLGSRLDAAGNSLAAIAALDEFTTASGLSVF